MNFRLMKDAGILAGLFFLSPLPLFATTFGPIQLIEQARNAQYVVRGRVLGAPTVRLPERIGRPYTYWNFQVIEQQLGEALPSELLVREPGGELGEMGYRVAGAADFAPGEDSFVFLRDTEEGAKELVGLSSGKYRVERSASGEWTVTSGLGLPVSGQDRKPLGLDAFRRLLKRVAANQLEPGDENIFVNRVPMAESGPHSEDNTANHEALRRVAADLTRRLPASPETNPSLPGAGSGSQKMSASDGPNSVQQTPADTEEPSTGSSAYSWILAVAIALGLLIGLVLFLRR